MLFVVTATCWIKRLGCTVIVTMFVLYRFGSLLTQSDSSGAVGSLLLYHPYFLAEEYTDYDLEFKTRCCYESDLCSLYYERRPTDDCASYRPPRFSRLHNHLLQTLR